MRGIAASFSFLLLFFILVGTSRVQALTQITPPADQTVEYGTNVEYTYTIPLVDGNVANQFIQIAQSLEKKNYNPGIQLAIHTDTKTCEKDERTGDPMPWAISKDGSIPTCTIDLTSTSGSITVHGYLNTSALFPSTFPSTFYYTILAGSLEPYPPFAVTLTKPQSVNLKLSATGAALWGKTGSISVNNITSLPGQKVTVDLTRDGGGYSNKFSFFVEDNGGKPTCQIDNKGKDGIFTFADGNLCPNGVLKATVKYSSDKFPKPTGQQTLPRIGVVTGDYYSFKLSGPNNASSKTLLTAETKAAGSLTVKVDPTDTYETGPATITITGCPSDSKISLTYKITAPADKINDKTYSFDMKSSNTFTISSEDGHFFNTDVRDTTVGVQAKCESTGEQSNTVSVTVKRIGNSNEKLILPTEIKSGVPFTVQLTGLNSKDPLCYYLRVQDLTKNTWLQPTNFLPADCQKKAPIHDFNDKPYYVGFWATSSEQPTDIQGLPDGLYNIYLLRVTHDGGFWDSVRTTGGKIVGGTIFYGSLAVGSITGPGIGTAIGGTLGYLIGNKVQDAITHMTDQTVDSRPFCIGGGCTGLYGSDTTPCLIGDYADGKHHDLANEFLSDGSKNPDYTQDLIVRAKLQDKIVKCTGVPTPFGIIYTDPVSFIKTLFQIMLSISGGIALFLIIRSGYQLLMSQGDAEQVKAARERLTSAIVGLLFLLFSLVILQVIGVDILHIPGFSK